MTRPPWLPLVILMTALTTLGCGLDVAVSSARIQNVVLVHGRRDDIIGWCTSQAVTDILVAGSMVALLWRSRTGFRRTDRVLTLMGIYAVNTGLVPCIMAIVMEIIFLSYTRSVHFIYVLFNTSLGGVYTFTLLANLNARIRMRSCLRPKKGEAINNESIFIPPQSLRIGPSPPHLSGDAPGVQYTNERYAVVSSDDIPMGDVVTA
ncbi:uncharacterized protein EI90DRAFT_2503791 [Cantharellus anzutake]|nr:uncharacterized protein EI90DRAFT_2503791 [Cantharellus anzutake]KAF8321478.1 hypothetical protein EI90DRAFT_2503791 [Cantharellus anzutake]